jgi:hypothetical protein
MSKYKVGSPAALISKTVSALVSHWEGYSMKAYVMTTRSVFGVLVLGHTWRATPLRRAPA